MKPKWVIPLINFLFQRKENRPEAPRLDGPCCHSLAVLRRADEPLHVERRAAGRQLQAEPRVGQKDVAALPLLGDHVRTDVTLNRPHPKEDLARAKSGPKGDVRGTLHGWVFEDGIVKHRGVANLMGNSF